MADLASLHRAVEIARAKLVILEERQKQRKPVDYPKYTDVIPATNAYHALLTAPDSTRAERSAAGASAYLAERRYHVQDVAHRAAHLYEAKLDLQILDARRAVEVAEDALTDEWRP